MFTLNFRSTRGGKNEIGRAFTSILIGGRHKFIKTKGEERPFSRNLKRCRYRFVE